MTNANGTLHWPGTILSPLRVLNHLILFAQLPGSPFLFGGIYTLNFFECRHRLLEAEGSPVGDRAKLGRVLKSCVVGD